jgi:hypothetical protein
MTAILNRPSAEPTPADHHVIYAVVMEAAYFEGHPPAFTEALLDGAANAELVALMDLVVETGHGTALFDAEQVAAVRDRINV